MVVNPGWILPRWSNKMAIVSSTDWDRFLSTHPNHHFLQTAAWGKLKSQFGWKPFYVIHELIGAQILFRQLPLGFSIAYIPKGPVLDENQQYPVNWGLFWDEIDMICKKQRAVFLKVEPDFWQESNSILEITNSDSKPQASLDPKTMLPPAGFISSAHTIQPPRTLIVDLSGSEEDILARMKQKTRYNIRLAQRRGVLVKPSDDIEQFSRLMQETGERDAFGVHSKAYYQRAMDLLKEHALVLMAELDSKPVAALFAVSQGRRACYLYGASSNQHRDAMPTYLIQWEAMRWAREQGCVEYDLWGVPDAPLEQLEAEFSQRSDGLWGVYRFKRGFGGELRRSAGAWDRIYNRVLYNLYRRRVA